MQVSIQVYLFIAQVAYVIGTPTCLSYKTTIRGYTSLKENFTIHICKTLKKLKF
jgi:hypothetical protein